MRTAGSSRGKSPCTLTQVVGRMRLWPMTESPHCFLFLFCQMCITVVQLSPSPSPPRALIFCGLLAEGLQFLSHGLLQHEHLAQQAIKNFYFMLARWGCVCGVCDLITGVTSHHLCWSEVSQRSHHPQRHEMIHVLTWGHLEPVWHSCSHTFIHPWKYTQITHHISPSSNPCTNPFTHTQ